jgi:ABC-2 type transport system ATP-binding protein
LRTIGRPDELRERLFSEALTVRTLAPLPDADRVFGSIPGIDSWHQAGSGNYVIAVANPTAVAPALTRALVKAGADVLSIGALHHSLEDVYLQLIDEDAGLEAGQK